MNVKKFGITFLINVCIDRLDISVVTELVFFVSSRFVFIIEIKNCRNILCVKLSPRKKYNEK